jgi:hypothetical protein
LLNKVVDLAAGNESGKAGGLTKILIPSDGSENASRAVQ